MSAATEQPAAPLDPEARAAYLSQFDAQRGGPTANLFHYAVREGLSTPEAVLLRVALDVRERLRNSRITPGDRAHLERVAATLREGPARALTIRYARYVLAYEALPAAERKRLKEGRSDEYRQEWMNQEPATPAQVQYLARLGVENIPALKGDASALIDRLLRERRGEP